MRPSGREVVYCQVDGKFGLFNDLLLCRGGQTYMIPDVDRDKPYDDVKSKLTKILNINDVFAMAIKYLYADDKWMYCKISSNEDLKHMLMLNAKLGRIHKIVVLTKSDEHGSVVAGSSGLQNQFAGAEMGNLPPVDGACQFNGEFRILDNDSIEYRGGKVVALGKIDQNILYDDLKSKIKTMCKTDVRDIAVLYFLPNMKRTYVTVSRDEDLKRMITLIAPFQVICIVILNKSGNRSLVLDSSAIACIDDETMKPSGPTVAVCHFGGKFVTLRNGSVEYSGYSRAVGFDQNIEYEELKAKITAELEIDVGAISIKYLRSDNRQAYARVSCDKDLKHMITKNACSRVIHIVILNKPEHRLRSGGDVEDKLDPSRTSSDLVELLIEQNVTGNRPGESSSNLDKLVVKLKIKGNECGECRHIESSSEHDLGKWKVREYDPEECNTKSGESSTNPDTLLGNPKGEGNECDGCRPCESSSEHDLRKQVRENELEEYGSTKRMKGGSLTTPTIIGGS